MIFHITQRGIGCYQLHDKMAVRYSTTLFFDGSLKGYSSGFFERNHTPSFIVYIDAYNINPTLARPTSIRPTRVSRVYRVYSTDNRTPRVWPFEHTRVNSTSTMGRGRFSRVSRWRQVVATNKSDTNKLVFDKIQPKNKADKREFSIACISESANIVHVYISCRWWLEIK